MTRSPSWQKMFYTVYTGQGFSLLSSSAVQFSIIWWITVQTESAIALTIASVVGLLPQAIMGPFAGVWIDRHQRKTIMILADLTVAVSSMVLFIICFFGTPSLLSVYIILGIRALGETFHKPAMQALIPQIVQPDALTKAGGFGQMISSACSMVGPMLGALLMSVTTLQYALLVDVAGAALAVLTLSSVKVTHAKAVAGKTPILSDLKKGFSTIRKNKVLMRLSIPMFISTVIFVPIGTLLPLIIKTYFGGNAWHTGVAQTLFSTGMLIAAGVVSITGGIKKQFLMIAFSTGLLGVCSLIAGMLPATLFWLFCTMVFLMGAAGIGFNVPFTAYVQRTIPQENLGKVLSLITSVMSFSAPIGMFIAGPVSEIIGVNKWFIIAGIVMIFIGILCYVLTRKFDMAGGEAE